MTQQALKKDDTLDGPVKNEWENCPIPTWEHLKSFALENALDKSLNECIERLHSKPRKRLHQFGKAFGYLAFRDPSFRKFINSSWEEIIDIIYTQIAENLKISTQYNQEQLKPVTFGSLAKVRRKYQQQPCSKLTSSRRVEYANKIVAKETPILLVGDDDLVSIELSRCGFKDITVLDIDEGVLGQIERLAKSESLDLRILQHDISKIPPAAICSSNYGLVFLDPFYSLEGISFFLSAAQEITKNSSDPCYFLSIHLMSLMRDGLQGLGLLLDNLNLKPVDFMQSFNFYPIPNTTRGLLYFLNQTLTKSSAHEAAKNFRFFTSDALVLKPKAIFPKF